MTEVEPDPESAPNSSPQDPRAAGFDPQAILAALADADPAILAALSNTDPAKVAGLSIADMEGDVEALMNDRMSQLDEMLDGLDQLVARIEGEMENIEGKVDPPQ